MLRTLRHRIGSRQDRYLRCVKFGTKGFLELEFDAVRVNFDSLYSNIFKTELRSHVFFELLKDISLRSKNVGRAVNFALVYINRLVCKNSQRRFLAQQSQSQQSVIN